MAVTFNKLSIVIPCYNEERTVHLILDKVMGTKLTNDISKELIIVNDCSKDGTSAAIENYFKAHPIVIGIYKNAYFLQIEIRIF